MSISQKTINESLEQIVDVYNDLMSELILIRENKSSISKVDVVLTSNLIELKKALSNFGIVDKK